MALVTAVRIAMRRYEPPAMDWMYKLMTIMMIIIAIIMITAPPPSSSSVRLQSPELVEFDRVLEVVCCFHTTNIARLCDLTAAALLTGAVRCMPACGAE